MDLEIIGKNHKIFRSNREKPTGGRLKACKGRVLVLLVSVVVAEAPDVVGGNVMDGAQHVVPVLHL